MKHKTWMQLRNAMEAVLADHSFDEVTVDMLTRQAGITRQAFYYTIIPCRSMWMTCSDWN